MEEIILKRVCHICGDYLPRRRSKFCSKKCFKEYRTAYQRELMREKHGWRPRIKDKLYLPCEEIKKDYIYLDIPLSWYVSNGSIR